MMIRKIFLLLSLFCLSVLAGETKVLIAKFNRSVNKEYAKSIDLILDKDQYYKMAMEYLSNPSKMKKNRILANDPEEIEEMEKEDSKIKPIYKNILLPNYIEALKEFKKSVDEYSNPLSAYIGMYIFKTKAPPKNISDIQYKRKFAKLLYKTTHSCMAYIDYADILMNGIGGKPNLAKAKRVLDEAKRCYPIASDWEKQIIEIKKYRVKKLEKGKR